MVSGVLDFNRRKKEEGRRKKKKCSYSPTLPVVHSPHFPLPQSGESSGGSSIAPKPPKLKTRNGGFDRT
ncbi:hypothetical protein [Microcoleus vaginatus]|uniref:hypothetical protein n=1 Tax=Microcoleus vaginatus TaxID=119532 RepID=UPI0032A48502